MDALDYFVIGFVTLFILTLIAYIFYGIGRDFHDAYQNHLVDEFEQARKEIYYLKVKLRETEYSREAIKNSHAHLAKLHNEQIDTILRLKNELAENESSYKKIMCDYNNFSEYHIKTVSDALKMNLDNEGLISENKTLRDSEVKNKNRIKELESACDRKNERIKNLEEVVLDLRIIVRDLKKQILDEKLSSEEFNTLKKEG